MFTQRLVQGFYSQVNWSQQFPSNLLHGKFPFWAKERRREKLWRVSFYFLLLLHVAWDRFGWSQMPSGRSRPSWFIPAYSFTSAVRSEVNDAWMPLLLRTWCLEALHGCQPSISHRMGSWGVQEQARTLGVSMSLGCGGGLKTVSWTFPNTDSADKSGEWTYSSARKARVRERQPKRPLRFAWSLVAPWRPTGARPHCSSPCDRAPAAGPCPEPRGRRQSGLIRSSLLPYAPWPERAACPGCPRGRVWQEEWGCCWRRAGGWQTGAQPPSAPGPSCAAQPRWRCGCFGSRRWAGRRGPWGLERSMSTAGSLERKETRHHHWWRRSWDCLTLPSVVNLERAEMGLESRMATTPSSIDL